jgi:hypothetical protein
MVDADEHLRALVVKSLTIIVLVALVGLTVVAVATDRDVRYAEGLTFGGVLIIAIMGGFSVHTLRRRHRWRLERAEVDDTPPLGRRLPFRPVTPEEPDTPPEPDKPPDPDDT